jgi:hypothetical protein
MIRILATALLAVSLTASGALEAIFLEGKAASSV